MEETDLIYTAEDVDAGQRADKFLGLVCEAFSRSRLQNLIMQGHVSCNDAVLKQASYKVEEGDKFTVRVPPPEPAEPEPENIPLDIVYEDDHVLVVNKPAGMVVHPGAGNWSGTLVNAVLHHCKGSLSGIGGVERPGIVHRLDKDTSGLMMVAKNDHAHQHLSEQLSSRTLSRVYHALVLGVPMPIKGAVDRPIGRHRHNRLKMSVMSNSPRDARTHYLVLKTFGEACALVECSLETGRTHQIRVHMEAIGHPLIGDSLYGPQQTGLISKLKKSGYSPEITKEFVEFPRQLLHAHAITFIHPVTENSMNFSAEAPGDMSNMLKKLEK